MKKEELRQVIFSKNILYELRIPLWIDLKTIATNVEGTISIINYAVYKRNTYHIYNEKNEKLYEYRLHHIVEKIE